MNRENAIKLFPIIKAFIEGKTVQHVAGGVWTDLADPNFGDPPVMYRIKPEPRVVQWTAENVPPICWIRRLDAFMPPKTHRSYHVVVGVGPEGVATHLHGFTWFELANEYEYSTDLKTWNPCTKVVEE